MGFKKEILVFFILLIYINSILAVTVVQQTEPPKEEEKSSFFGFLKSPIFWWAVIGLIVLALLGIGLVFFIKWLVSFIKQRNNIFYRIKMERLYMAKLHARYLAKHWWKIEKNTPVRLIRNNNGKAYVSEPIGYHRGDYTTNEGNILISLNLIGNNMWFIFPKRSLLIIPNKEEVEVQIGKEKDGKPKTTIISNIPKADTIVQFNPNEILLYAESVSQVGEFLIPVLKSKDNKIIDLSIPVYHTIKEVAMHELMYEQTDLFGKLSKKGMEVNPDIRARIKLADSQNQNVELPSGNPQ